METIKVYAQDNLEKLQGVIDRLNLVVYNMNSCKQKLEQVKTLEAQKAELKQEILDITSKIETISGYKAVVEQWLAATKTAYQKTPKDDYYRKGDLLHEYGRLKDQQKTLINHEKALKDQRNNCWKVCCDIDSRLEQFCDKKEHDAQESLTHKYRNLHNNILRPYMIVLYLEGAKIDNFPALIYGEHTEVQEVPEFELISTMEDYSSPQEDYSSPQEDYIEPQEDYTAQGE